jgi:hypothetical protein
VSTVARLLLQTLRQCSRRLHAASSGLSCCGFRCCEHFGQPGGLADVTSWLKETIPTTGAVPEASGVQSNSTHAHRPTENHTAVGLLSLLRAANRPESCFWAAMSVEHWLLCDEAKPPPAAVRHPGGASSSLCGSSRGWKPGTRTVCHCVVARRLSRAALVCKAIHLYIRSISVLVSRDAEASMLRLRQPPMLPEPQSCAICKRGPLIPSRAIELAWPATHTLADQVCCQSANTMRITDDRCTLATSASPSPHNLLGFHD